MSDKKSNIYDDGNIPEIDLPQSKNEKHSKEKSSYNTASLPEFSHSRKDKTRGD